MKRPFNAYCGREPYTFVSYARGDAGVVYPLLAALHGEGFRVWYDEGIEPGLGWRDEIASAIVDCSLFLMFITPRSVTSPVCAQELNFALSYDRRILAVHLEETLLPPGMELSLNEQQAIIRDHYSEAEFSDKLRQVLGRHFHDVEQISPDVRDAPADGIPSIAILPFVNRGDAEQGRYLSEGIADELIHGLSLLQGLRVVSGFAFRNQNLDARKIGRRCKVHSVLDGSVQQSGERLRIMVRLTDTRDGSLIWSERYDQETSDIFAIQDNVVAAVLEALRVSLSIADRGRLDIGTQRVDAYEAYLLGTYEKRKDERWAYDKAIGHFTRATEIDPSFGRAFFQLGICYWELTVHVGLDPHIIRSAEQAFGQAQRLGYEPDVPWIHVHRRLHPEVRPAQRELALEALDRIRNEDASWHRFEYAQFGRCLGSAGLYQAAFDFLSQYPTGLAELSSRIESVENDLQSLLPVLHRFGEAIDALTRRLDDQPDDLQARQGRAMLLSRTGQFGRAQADIKALSATPAADFARFYDLYWQGRQEEARSLLDPLLLEERLPLRFKFWACALTGQIDQAMEHIEASAARGAPVFNIRVLLSSALPKDRVAELEADPRFRRFLASFGIDADWRAELRELANSVTGLTGVYVSPHD